jgi:5-methyltetrahydrofolate--homocysteine methyltransferase
MIGGAAINRKFGRRILFLEETDQPYEPGVFYCKDAFEGLSVMDALSDPETRPAFIERIHREAFEELAKPVPARRARVQGGAKTVQPAPTLPLPPFFGTRTIVKMPLEIVMQYVDKPELFRLSWGASNTHGDEWFRLEAEYEARLMKMTREAGKAGTLRPQAAYGFFPVASEGDDLVIFDPAPYQVALEHGRLSTDGRLTTGGPVRAPELAREIARFHFPRQPYGEHLCISDYFATRESGLLDTVALQVVTVGEVATEHHDRLQAESRYSDAYFFHGLAVQAAEATASYVHQEVVRKALGIGREQGKRYSWGYPSCPDLRDHAALVRLLPTAESQLGMTLTESLQWVPEQSTAAIVLHHPDAKYFNIGVDRVEQIERA